MKKQGADVIGAKAGAKPKKPYIQKDTIGSTQNAEIVYGIGDGENGGLINGLNSIILDGTRVIGSSGEVNFNEVKYEERFGLIDQPPLKLIEDTITERGLNLEVRSAAPVVSSFNNKDADKFVVRISVPSLMQNKDNGDSVAASISYAIDISVDGGAYQTVVEASATEKITNGYEFEHEIEAPEGTQRTIRVRRTTPDSTSQLLINKFYVAAISEVINAKFSHPTLHHIGLVFNAEQFNNIPKVVFHYYGRKIKVPVNYNPTTRQYDGIWNGTFKVVYSNNPAWVLFDILTDRRSGLGRRIPVELVDKWELYRIAQYCDELVPDGEGGMEPRFVCNNLVLNSKQDAYQVLKDIASIFRGQSFWNGSQVVTVADAPRDIDYAISMASVISYSYSGTARNARHNVVKVQYYDKNNENSAAYEYATDYDSIRETEQINEVEIRAFGCTSAGQAQRLARYTLLSEQTETRILTAKLSMDAFVNMQIGDVFAWSDKFLAGANNGGRVVAVNGAELTLDRDVTDSALVGDTLFVNTTSGKASARTITAINGNKVTLDAVMTTTEPEFVWVIDSADLSLLYFKLDDYKVNPAEGTVDIVGIQHVNSKFGTIDTETALEAPPFSKVEIETLRAPGNVTTNYNVRVDQGINIADLYVAWGQVKGATRYTVEFRRDDQAWRILGTVTGLTHTIENVSAGIYEVRVRAADSIGNLSPYGFAAPINVAGVVLPPPKLTYFAAEGRLLAIATKWTFPAGTEASLAVVIEHATQDPTNVGVPTQKLNIPYPQTEYVFNGLGAHTQMWFRAAIVDKYNQEGAYTAWTTATADANPEELIDLISGHISEGTLDQTLKGKIDGAGALAGEAHTLANQAKTAAANAQTTANGAATAAADAAGKATAAATAVAKEVTDRVAAVTAETNARTAALTKEATDRAAALTTQSNTLKADSAAKVKALKDEIDPKLVTLQDGITKVTTDYKAADTVVVGQLNAYKTSNDSAVASVLQKAESAVATGATNSSAITALAGRVSTVEGAVSTKAEAAALTALTTRVTSAEGVNTSQGSAITSLENSVNHATTGLASKASSAALTAVDNKVTSANGRIDTTNSNVTTLTGRVSTVEGDVAKKADASALTALTTRVGNAEGVNTSQGTAITTLQNTVNHATTGLATKASTSALTATNSEVSRVNGLVTGHTNQLTQLAADITTINGNLATKADASALNDIYTKTQADAKAQEIAAGEVSKYSAELRVGGINLAEKYEDGKAFSEITFQGSSVQVTARPDLKDEMVSSSDPFEVSSTGGTSTLKTTPQLVAYKDAIVVITFKVKNLAATPLRINFNGLGSQVIIKGGNLDSIAPDVIQEFEVTGRMRPDYTWAQFQLHSNAAGNAIKAVLADVQLEVGNKATSWKPPAYLTQQALDANATAIQDTQAAVTQANGRIDATNSNVTALTGRVSTVEGAVSTKADASALNSLTTRVTTEEGKSTSQGTAITSLQNAVNHSTTGLATKASSAALTIVDNKVTAVDGRVNTTNSNVATLTGRVSTVEGAVATKAEAAAVSALTTRVGNVEGGLESASSSITSLTNSLDASISAIRLVPTQVSIDTVVKTSPNTVIELMDDASTTVPKVIKVKGFTSGANMFAGPHVQLNPNTLYKVSYKVKRLSGTGTFYLAVMPLTQDKSNGVSSANALQSINTITSTTYPFVGTTSAAPVDVWKEGVYYIKGVNPAGASGSGTIASPRIMPNLAAFLRLGAIVPANTEFALEYFTVEAADADGLDAATSAAITATNSEVARVDGRVTSTNSNVTALTGRVSTVEGGLSTKADVSAVNALTTRVGNVEGGLSTQANNTTALEAKLSTTMDVASLIANSKLLYPDTAFDKGTNSVGVYSNIAGKGTVARVARWTVDNPTTSSGQLNVTISAESTPNYGGFAQYIQTRANAVFVVRYLLKLPVGYSLVPNGNAKGTGGTDEFVSSAEGTGKYETYIRLIKCGSSGTFSSVGHVSVRGTALTGTQTLTFPVASIEAYDATDYSIAHPDVLDGLAVNANAISTTNTEVSRIDGVVSGHVTDIRNLTTSIAGKADASALNSLTARVETEEGKSTSQGTAITNLQNAVNHSTTGLASKASSSALTTLNNQVQHSTTGLSAVNTKVDSLKATVENTTNGLASKASSSALDTLSNKVNHSTTGLDAIASKTTVLESDVAKALDVVTISDTRSTNQPPSWYWANYARRTVNEFKTQTVIGVSGFFGGTYCNLETNIPYGDASGGHIVQTATSSADPSLYVQRVSTSTAAWGAWAQPIKDLRDDIAGKAAASAVESLTTRVSTAEGKAASEATKLTNLSTTVGGHTTTINSQTTSINGIRGVHAMKFETNGVISGYGLISELVNGTVKSQFGINADNFFIGAPSSNKKPFIVYTSPGLINGVTVPAGTYIDTAFIGAATIGTAHINNLAVTTAKIGNGQITTAKIGNAQVDTLQIAGEAVTVPTSISNENSFTANYTQFNEVPHNFEGNLAYWENLFGTIATVTLNRTGGKVRFDATLSYADHKALVFWGQSPSTLTSVEANTARAVMSIYRGATLVGRAEIAPTGFGNNNTPLFQGTYNALAIIDDSNITGTVTYTLKFGFSNRLARGGRVVWSDTTAFFTVRSPRLIATEMKR